MGQLWSLVPVSHSGSKGTLGMRLSRLVAAACPPALVLGVLGAGPAAAAPAPDWESPFPCGQQWVGSTRSSHSPSYYSVDFNRPDDLEDLVTATAPGVVTRVANTGSTSYGQYIIVDHGDGYNSLYAHMHAQYVTTGQRVDQGHVLGLVGSSGGSTGPHLHFEEKLWSQVQRPYFHQSAYSFGSTLTSRNCPDVPLAGNFNGSGGDEWAVYRRAPGNGVFRIYREGAKPLRITLGYGADTPVVGDWDGNGKTDVGVRRPGLKEWMLRTSDGRVRKFTYGWRSDVPVTGDWDGDGTTEVGVWRPSTATFRLRVSAGDVRVTKLGSVGSLPVTGDWNGDGMSDIGVYNPGSRQFTIRNRPIGAAPRTYTFGKSRDIPVPGDWDGNGRTNLATWSPATATYAMRSPGGTVTTKKFGLERIR